jgi:DNA-binding CsgD family transcriptional regulator
MTLAPLVVFATDAQGVFTMTAGAGMAALKRKPGDAVGKPAGEFCPRVHDAVQRALAGERVSLRAEIHGRIFETSYVPQYDDSGVLEGIVGVAFDVTEQPGALDERVEHLASSGRLSPREREVLQLMLLGRSRSDIALVLGVTERTAKYHVENVLRKLDAESRVDLLRIVLTSETAT